MGLSVAPCRRCHAGLWSPCRVGPFWAKLDWRRFWLSVSQTSVVTVESLVGRPFPILTTLSGLVQDPLSNLRCSSSPGIGPPKHAIQMLFLWSAPWANRRSQHGLLYAMPMVLGGLVLISTGFSWEHTTDPPDRESFLCILQRHDSSTTS